MIQVSWITDPDPVQPKGTHPKCIFLLEQQCEGRGKFSNFLFTSVNIFTFLCGGWQFQKYQSVCDLRLLSSSFIRSVCVICFLPMCLTFTNTSIHQVLKSVIVVCKFCSISTGFIIYFFVYSLVLFVIEKIYQNTQDVRILSHFLTCKNCMSWYFGNVRKHCLLCLIFSTHVQVQQAKKSTALIHEYHFL